MDRDRLALVLAAVFAGLTTVLVVAAFVAQPFLLLVALPFAATTYLLWYHASGRLAARTRRRASRADGRGSPAGGRVGDDRRRAAGPGARRGGVGARAGGDGGAPPSRGPAPRLSREEALARLGLEPGADAGEIRRAYRERAKEVHPDTATGDEESFKRLTRAYERLSED